jgi:y4mF family transcriptional regulator
MSPPTEPTVVLGRAVRAWRRRLRLSQATLADLAGVGVAFVYDLERGKPTLRIDKVLAVLEALGLGLTIGPSGQLVRSQTVLPDREVR